MQATADNFVSVDTFVIAQTFVSLGIQFSIPMRYFSKIVIKSIIKVIFYDIIKNYLNIHTIVFRYGKVGYTVHILLSDLSS